MSEPDKIAESISTHLKNARDLKHRQRFYGAIAEFKRAEQEILAQVPPDLRAGADAPQGPGPTRVAALGRALFEAAARLRAAGELADVEPPGDPAHVPLDDDALAVAARRIARLANGPNDTPFLLRLSVENIPANLAPFYFADIPLGIGESLVQLGQDYQQALDYYARAESYVSTFPGFKAEDLWLRLAEVFLARGDASYRSGDLAGARGDYECIVRGGDVPVGTRLYSGILGGMAGQVRAWIQAVKNPPANPSPVAFPPPQMAMVAAVLQRLAQLDSGFDFLGEKEGARPIFSFAYLRDIARGLAQFAAQANREYLSFTQRAEDETQNVQQFEQAVALADAGVAVEEARAREGQRELEAAEEAQRLAKERADLAQQNTDDYSHEGWDIVELDAASAWASVASSSKDDEIKQKADGLEDLGVSGEQRRRSEMVQLLAWQRARRSYELERRRMERAAKELRDAQGVASAQTATAQARMLSAGTAVSAARWRSQFARMSLAAASGRETSAELYFELGRLVKETARTYLQRAIGAARAMEAAYNFENNTAVRRIRLDYGDLGGAGALFAADFLLRDIDAFLYDHVTATRSKSQLVIQSLSLRREFPLQFAQFLRTGEMIFQTTLDQFHGEKIDGHFQGAMPGVFNARIKKVAVDASGISAAHGALTCAGVSGVRAQNGGRIDKVHPAETMLIPPLTPEKAFAWLDATAAGGGRDGELAVFENMGLACSWKLEIPLRSNNLFLTSASDVSLVFAYLCQHDARLEAADKQALPTTGEAQFTLDLRALGQDAARNPVFGRLEKTGEAVFALPPEYLPRYAVRTQVQAISIFGVRVGGAPQPLVLRFSSLAGVGDPARVYRPDPADQVTRVAPAGGGSVFEGTAVAGSYRLALPAADNPALAANAPGAVLDLSAVHEISVVFQYEYDFR